MIQRILDVFRGRVVGFVTIALLGLLGGFVTLVTATPRYDATTTVLFSVRPAPTPLDALAGSIFASTRMTSYAAVVDSPAVLDPVITRLGLHDSVDSLSDRVTATADTDGLTVDIVASDPSAVEAAAIANAVASELADVLTLRIDRQNTDAGSVLDIRTIAPADPPTAPAAPAPAPTLALALGVGLVMALGMTLLRASLSRRVLRESDLVLRLPVMGRIRWNDRHDGRNALGAASDAEFGVLAQNLRFGRFEQRSSSLLVVGCEPSAGSTTIALGLGAAVARTGRRAVVVDANLVAPSAASMANVYPVSGLTDLVVRQFNQSWVVHEVPDQPGLFVVGAGERVPNPLELLGSAALGRRIAALESVFDEVIVDAPAFGGGPYAAALAPHAGSALVVIGLGTTASPASVAETVDGIRATGTPIAGVALNRTRDHGRLEGMPSIEPLAREAA